MSLNGQCKVLESSSGSQDPPFQALHKMVTRSTMRTKSRICWRSLIGAEWLWLLTRSTIMKYCSQEHNYHIYSQSIAMRSIICSSRINLVKDVDNVTMSKVFEEPFQCSWVINERQFSQPSRYTSIDANNQRGKLWSEDEYQKSCWGWKNWLNKRLLN